MEKRSVKGHIFGLVFWLTMATLACTKKDNTRPANLIGTEKMAKVLGELHIMESKINNMGIQNSDTASFIYRKLEADIFKKYDIDTSAYYSSYKYYLINPEKFSDMYNEVVENIKAQNKLDSIADAKKPKVDTSHKRPATSMPADTAGRKFKLHTDKLQAIKSKINNGIK